MDPEMLTLYPDGIRVLLVDDDSRFLRTASMLLSLLNFKVSTCGSPSSALKVLSAGDKFKDVDVVLVDAKKATTCGFDFKAIVEPDLRVPVLYFLSQNHRSAGAEADALLRTLDMASFILKKPFDADDMCNLWRDIAWRKCCLNGSRTGDVGQDSTGGGGYGLLPPWAAGSSSDGEEERVHFRVIRGVRGRKRKGVAGSSVPPVPERRRGRPAKNWEQTDDVAEQEADHVVQAVPRKCRSKKAKKKGESASMPELPEANDVEPQPPQPKQSLFEHSVLQTLDVPPYNTSIFADAVERGSSVIPFSGSGNTAAVAPATPPPVFSATAPTPPSAYQAPTTPALAAVVSPAPALPVVHHQQHQTMSASLTDKESALLPHLLAGAFGPFPYQGPLLPPPAGHQDMFAPRMLPTTDIQLPFQQPSIAAGDPFTAGTVGGAAIEAADDATHAGGDYGNTASTLMQSLQLGGAEQDEDEVAGMMAMYNTTADPYLMVPQPQHVDDDMAAMYYYDNNNAAMFYNDSGEPFVVAAHDQDLDLAYGVNDPAMAGGAFDGNAAAFMAPQGYGTVPNVNQLAMGDDLAAVVAFDGNEEDYSFPLEALLGTDDMQMYDAGLDGQQGGATEGARTDAADVDAAETYLNDWEGGVENSWGMGPLADVAMLDEMLMNNTVSDLFPYYMNNGCE